MNVKDDNQPQKDTQADRECMEFDVVIVGAGPAGLSCACHLAQLAIKENNEVSICVVEKAAQVGAHIVSGAVFETSALDELFPDWPNSNAPLKQAVTEDQLRYLTTDQNHINIPRILTPKPLHNHLYEQYIISVSELAKWLAKQAEDLGVQIFPGFSASQIASDDEGNVTGIITSDMGRDKDGNEKPNFMPGIWLKAQYTVLSEGARGHLGKAVIMNFDLDNGKQPQHYGLGFKEIWKIDQGNPNYYPGKVVHTVGWPLSSHDASGGGFIYHLDDHQIAVGLIVDLSYRNPYLSPFDEFQQFKHHPSVSNLLTNGERLSYGARAIAKGGLLSLPKQSFAGGLLIGCDAGTLNGAKIKGTHTAMRSGMLAAKAIFEELVSETPKSEPDYESHFKHDWLYEELEQAQNFGSSIHQFGTLIGGVVNTFDYNVWQNITASPLPWKVTDRESDHASLRPIAHYQPIEYPKPDGQISFDKTSSVYLSNIQHDENQPCHLKVKDKTIPITTHFELYLEPAQRYCPAGVYEIVEEAGSKRLQINAANCLHCKTCDIKDPSQNIDWVAPEGGSGPNYQGM